MSAKRECKKTADFLWWSIRINNVVGGDDDGIMVDELD